MILDLGFQSFKVSKFLFIFILLSCNRSSNPNAIGIISPEKIEEGLVTANKKAVKDESVKIESYIKRHNWKMSATGTGLRYMIEQKGNGEKPSLHKQVSIRYSLNLLDGTLCYSTKQNEPLKFTTGQAEVPNGLEECVMLMRAGDKAKIIVPAHLGYGFRGDDNKIPHNATLIYDLELIEVK